MKFILALLVSLFLAAPAAMAAPNATLRADNFRRYVYLTFSDLRTVSRVSYTLVYNTSSSQKGIEGGFRTTPKTRSTSRKQILGSCSGKRCVFHPGVRNLKLDVSFTLRSGGVVNVTKSLP